jgi:phosphatidylglycerophosphatase A
MKSSKVWQDPIYFIAFGFGTGLMPFAPGTWGTLAAIPLYLLLAGLPLPLYLSLTVLAFFLGVWVSERVSKELGVHDYSGIVWDEVVGYLLTMTLVPVGLFWMIAGFLLFRLFDIWKPQPIGWVDERVKGGLGVMLDDVLAAIPAWLILQLLVWSFTK